MARKNRQLPKHLLVFRTSAMGDVAMVPHALRALMKAYPELRITVVTGPQFKPFFRGLGVEFLDIDLRDKHHSLLGIWRLAADARRLGVDAVADLHGVLRSQTFRASMWLHGIPVAYIHKGRREKRHFIRAKGNLAPLRHSVDRYCDVFRRLGFEFEAPQPAVHPECANPMGEKQGVWVGFAPFSAQRGKTYPLDLAGEAVGLLAARYERVFVHGGGGREGEFAQQMEQTYPNVTGLNGKLRFDGELNLLSHLDCVVSMDSLVMHLASLVATPVVSVWGATHPGAGFLGYGCDPRGVLRSSEACSPCSVYGSKPCKFGDYRCMRAVTPQMIVERVAEVVGR